jgi:hypothetical protein
MKWRTERFDCTVNLDQQRALFKDCFPETQGDAMQGDAHYRWKFHGFPFEPASWEYAGYLDDEMVGYYAAIPYRYQIGLRQTPVGMVCDVMTSSRHRGQGIFTKMGFYATGDLAQSVPFTMGYPIRKEVIPGHMKVGWQVPFQLPMYLKFYRLNALLNGKKLGFLAPLMQPFLSLYNALCTTASPASYRIEVCTRVRDMEGYDALMREWLRQQPNALVKDLNFATWRYGAPEKQYVFLGVRTAEGKLVGFVSLRRVMQEGIPVFGILDYTVLKGYADCHGLLHKEMKRMAAREGVEALMVMMSRTSATTYRLLRHGFLKSPFVFSLIIKRLNDSFSAEELFAEKDWHLMWVDSDDL